MNKITRTPRYRVSGPILITAFSAFSSCSASLVASVASSSGSSTSLESPAPTVTNSPTSSFRTVDNRLVLLVARQDAPPQRERPDVRLGALQPSHKQPPRLLTSWTSSCTTIHHKARRLAAKILSRSSSVHLGKPFLLIARPVRSGNFVPTAQYGSSRQVRQHVPMGTHISREGRGYRATPRDSSARLDTLEIADDQYPEVDAGRNA